MQFRVSATARRDLQEIFVYWAERASPTTADRLIRRITDRFWLLGAYPGAGKSCPELARGLRCFPAGKYLIYYRSSQRQTDILHIFHGARNQEDAFNERESE